MNEDFLKSVITERHDYARHSFTSMVTWFTFFVTVNYASMGWLATSKDGALTNASGPIVLVAAVFVTQNILGIIICFVMKNYFVRSNQRLFDAQKLLLNAQGFV